MNHTIVCGLGQVGYRVTLLLLQFGEPVHVVTQDSRPGFIDEVSSLGAKVTLADARDSKSLLEAGISEAKALIACTSSDLSNIEISLDARALRADLRIVARIFDQNLAQRLKESVGIDETLAMSLMAAPKFAAEALRNESFGQFTSEGRRYVVQTGKAIEPSDIGLEAEGLGSVRIRPIPETIPLPPMSPQYLRRFQVLLASIPASLKVLSGIILFLMLVSVGVFCRTMDLSLIDSFYFVVTTLTTTGYGDISVKDQTVWVKLYACWMMILGSATVATLYSIITDYIVSARFSDVLGTQSVDMSDHVVVVGIGNVGLRICQSLHSAGVQVVAIDADGSSRFRGLIPTDIPFLIGDGREAKTLSRASVERCQAVIATTNDDSINLSVGLASKSLSREVRTVLRLFDANFAHKVETTLDIDRALSASMLSAPGFVASALYPSSIF